jgi:hypothetical protein
MFLLFSLFLSYLFLILIFDLFNFPHLISFLFSFYLLICEFLFIYKNIYSEKLSIRLLPFFYGNSWGNTNINIGNRSIDANVDWTISSSITSRYFFSNCELLVHPIGNPCHDNSYWILSLDCNSLMRCEIQSTFEHTKNYYNDYKTGIIRPKNLVNKEYCIYKISLRI